MENNFRYILIKEILNWEPDTSLENGLKITYNWVLSEIANGNRKWN
jgi:nucleoside-diphosphate-sugar epimerase